MNITLFGGSGGTGRLIVRKALEAGHSVRALARNPAKLGISHPALTVIPGDACDRGRVAEAIAGADCAVSAIGPVRGDAPGLMRSFAENLVASLQQAGVRRLVYMSGAGVLQPEDPPALAPKVILPLMKLLAREVLEDSTAGVARVQASPLDWTVVRAPRLDDSAPRGQCRIGYIKPKLAAMSRADVADIVLGQITSEEYVRKLPIVSY